MGWLTAGGSKIRTPDVDTVDVEEVFGISSAVRERESKSSHPGSATKSTFFPFKKRVPSLLRLSSGVCFSAWVSLGNLFDWLLSSSVAPMPPLTNELFVEFDSERPPAVQ